MEGGEWWRCVAGEGEVVGLEGSWTLGRLRWREVSYLLSRRCQIFVNDLMMLEVGVDIARRYIE